MRHDALSSVTVVIASWGSPEHTLRSAKAVIADGCLPSALVVDDGSGDENADRPSGAARLPRGAAAAERRLPLGRQRRSGRAGGRLVLVLNNDAFLHRPGSVGRMLEALGERVGIVVPRLLNPDLTLQPSVRPFDTPSVALVRASGLSRCVPNRHQPSWSTHWDHSESREIRAADGAVLLLRAEAWQQLDGFSPRAYMYAEDTDICWRAQRLGWKVRFEATAEFVHLGNATGAGAGRTPSARSAGAAQRPGSARAALARPVESVDPVHGRRPRLPRRGVRPAP